MDSPLFHLLTRMQDEVHRFANAYRKQQMHKKSYASTLAQIPGVGAKTAKALTDTFKSVAAVREADVAALEKTPGVGKALAQVIFDYFHAEQNTGA